MATIAVEDHIRLEDIDPVQLEQALQEYRDQVRQRLRDFHATRYQELAEGYAAEAAPSPESVPGA